MGLWDQLFLDMDTHRVVALVGGGGKSSTLYALARQARDTARTVIITTTTHIIAHPSIFLTDETDPGHLTQALKEHGVLTLGRVLREGKLAGAGDLTLCHQLANITLVEADGARGLPLKAPGDHEPAIPPCTDVVVALAGMDAVGQSIRAACHRPEQVCALLGCPATHTITPGDVATILTSPTGGRKSVGGIAFRCVLNKADTPQRKQYAADISRILKQQGIISVATNYDREERGGKCLF